MDKKEIQIHTIKLLLYLPNAYRTCVWWWNVFSGIDRRSLIAEHDLHGAVEWAKSFCKKEIESDEDLDNREKECMKIACDIDLAYAEELMKRYELEEVSLKIYRYRGPYTPVPQPPHWFLHVQQRCSGTRL